MAKANPENLKAMMECSKLKSPVSKEKWSEIAEKYGYKSGSSLRTTYVKWKRQAAEKREKIKKLAEKVVQNSTSVKLPDIQTEFKKDIEKGITLHAAMEKYQVCIETIESMIDKFRKSGLNIMRAGKQIYLSKIPIQSENILRRDWSGERVIRFAIISDSHIGSKYQQIGLLNSFYDICNREEISDVFCAGDISEGIKMRPGHEQECFLHGADDIEDYIIQNFPRREGITTQFITGNHDHSIIKLSGHDIGKKIEQERDDMIYLGMSNAKVYLTPNCIMELNHPLDGAAYALSYSIQKLADSLSGGEKPNILINGHHHKALYLFYRNIHMLEAGCFQAQTPFMKGKRISAHVGGYIVTVHVDESGTVTRFIPEFIPFYEMAKNDYTLIF